MLSCVPVAECYRVLDRKVQVVHVDVVLMPENAGIEYGGTDVVIVEERGREVVDEVGRWGDEGVVGELGGYQGVKYLVDYRRRV